MKATIDWNKVKIHCSALSQIMVSQKRTNMQLYLDACSDIVKKQEAYDKLKTKNGARGMAYIDDIDKLNAIIPILESQKDIEDPLSTGAKSHLATVYAKYKYNKWSPSKDIGSKATEKGKEVEPEALALVSILDGVLLVKNEERIENEWFSGLPDAYEGEKLSEATIVHDVKSPFDIESFFSYLDKDLPAAYYWQMQSYMDLTGAKLAKVHFCLVNTPEHTIKRISDALLSRMDVISEYAPEFIKAQNELVNNLTFDDMDMNERRFFFIVERNDEDILRAKKRVELCREWLSEFEQIHMSKINS